MSTTNAGVKLRALAAANPTMQSFFGTGPFRWQERQLTQGYIQQGACVRVLRLGSPLAGFTHSGPSVIEECRMQIDVLCMDADHGRAAAAAVDQFLQTVNLVAQGPGRGPNYKLGQREGMDYQLGTPVYVEILDYRIFNSLSTTN